MEIIEVKDVAKAVHDLREVVESKTANLAESKEKIDKLENQLGKLLDQEQETKGKILAAEQKSKELAEQVKDLETAISRSSSNRFEAKAYKNTEEYKALQEFAVKGTDMLAPETKGYLRTDVDTVGGFLVPSEMDNELQRNIVEISPMRQVCRIKRTNGRSLEVVLRNTNLSSNALGEGQASTPSNSQYQIFDIKVNKITAESWLTLEEMQDAAFDMEAEINRDMTIEFERAEGAQFINGTGVNQAIGIMTDANISTVNSGLSNGIQFDNFLDLTNIKFGYTLTYAMNRSTLIYASKLKDNIGQYLWQPAVEAGRFPTLNGHRYIMMIDMASISANNYPVICGDFNVGYTIVDKVGMYLVRDIYTQASSTIIRLIATRRVGGQTTRPEAFLKLKVST